MKVLHVAETIKGGVATVINELVHHQLNDHDFEEIITLVPQSQVDELNYKGKSLTFNRTGRNILSICRLTISFINALIKHKPDVIHLHSTFAGFVCRLVLILLPFKRKVLIYCPHAFSFLMVTSKLKQKIYIQIEKILQFKNCKIICVSKHEYNKAIDFGLNPSKLEVIYNGVNNEDDRSQNDSSDRERPLSVFNIIFVGRFDYQKGYDLLCDVISKLDHDANKKIQFTLVGGYVNEHSAVNNLSYNNIINRGWLSKKEVAAEYLKADLLVIPSRWEGFAMVPLEAFKARLPVLASDFPSFLEIVKDGSTGFLFENGNVDDLYAKIMQILSFTDRDAKLKKIADAAHDELNKSFTSKIMFVKTKELYKRCSSEVS